MMMLGEFLEVKAGGFANRSVRSFSEMTAHFTIYPYFLTLTLLTWIDISLNEF